MEFLTQDSWKNFICSFFDNAFLLIKSAELIHQLCEIGFENEDSTYVCTKTTALDWKLDSKSLLKGYVFDFFWNGCDGLDAPKDAAEDALKDAPDDSSVVEENQVIEDVDRRDACKECTKKMTVVSLFKVCFICFSQKFL